MLTEREQEVLKLRQEGLTQTEVATALKISQAAVSNFERNAQRKVADAQEVLRIAKELGVDQ